MIAVLGMLLLQAMKTTGGATKPQRLERSITEDAYLQRFHFLRSIGSLAIDISLSLRSMRPEVGRREKARRLATSAISIDLAPPTTPIMSCNPCPWY
jgi:hypothetical protein